MGRSYWRLFELQAFTRYHTGLMLQRAASNKQTVPYYAGAGAGALAALCFAQQTDKLSAVRKALTTSMGGWTGKRLMGQ